MKPITTLELDCRAQQCPVPVLQLAKAAARVGDGGCVLIRADDPAFPKDLRAWARSAGSQIVRFDECGGYYEAAVLIGRTKLADAPAEPPTSLAPTITDSARPTQTFDLRRQPAATLIDIVAKACARSEPDAVIAFLVDDPDFLDRLQQWLPSADATLLATERRGSLTELRLRVDPPPPEPRALARPAPMVAPELERCTLLVLHNDHEALLAALLIANGAAAQGMETTVFFTFWGLNLLRAPSPDETEPEPEIGLMQRLMKWMMPKGPDRQPLGKMHFAGLGKGMLSSIMRRQQIMSLPELMDSAQQLGVRFTACTMSMSVMGIAPRDLHPYPNLDFGGVASFVEEARGSAINMVF
jgi:peroxiredoxin family protein/TusA-related sulfurtransferase